MENIEIERKWKLEYLPNYCKYNSEKKRIDQGYIFNDDFELRIRRSVFNGVTNYYITTKSNGNLVRNEWETEIPKWVYDSLSVKVKSFLIKDRFITYRDDLKFEIDNYYFNLAGLIILECEFNTIQEANSFVLPEWIGPAVEITNDDYYKNKNLIKLC